MQRRKHEIGVEREAKMSLLEERMPIPFKDLELLTRSGDTSRSSAASPWVSSEYLRRECTRMVDRQRTASQIGTTNGVEPTPDERGYG